MKAPLTSLAAIAIMLRPCLATPVPDNHVRHEARLDSSQNGWTKRSAVEGSMRVPVRIGLTQSNLERGAEMLLDIAHPASPLYGKHLSRQEVHELFAPSAERVRAVRGWLAASPVGHRTVTLSPNKQWLQFEASVQELQELLFAEYRTYENPRSGKMALGCDEYHVPASIREHVDYITPGVKTLELKAREAPGAVQKRDNGGGGGKISPKITPMGAQPQTAGGNADCSFAVTPACVRQLYNITDTIKGNAANSLGIYETDLQFYNQTDLDLLFKTFVPSIPQGTGPKYNPVDGAPRFSAANYTGDEADLDFQAAYPLVYPDRVLLFEADDLYYETIGSQNISGLFNTFLDSIDGSYCTYRAFGETGDAPGVDPTYPDAHPDGYDHPEQCGVYAAPNVVSISYSIDEDHLPMNYQRRQCNEWMKLGLQGVSVIVSSGDSGVAPREEVCERNNTLFATQSPIDCPWVTAVGATALPPGAVAGKDPETAVTQFGSGGGFSNVFPQPSYQANVVATYFKDSPPPYPYYDITYNATHTKGIYNRGGRGYPDLSATGQNFATYYEGFPSFAAGTSVSAPVVAGIITRINSARLNAGKKPVGFINPTIYQHPEVFNDITSGNNPGCQTKGFSAVNGWDPVTGLGTPNYGKMKDLFMSLQ